MTPSRIEENRNSIASIRYVILTARDVIWIVTRLLFASSISGYLHRSESFKRDWNSVRHEVQRGTGTQ